MTHVIWLNNNETSTQMGPIFVETVWGIIYAGPAQINTDWGHKRRAKGKCTKSRRRQEANRVSVALERTQEMEEKRWFEENKQEARKKSQKTKKGHDGRHESRRGQEEEHQPYTLSILNPPFTSPLPVVSISSRGSLMALIGSWWSDIIKRKKLVANVVILA